ncbi:methylenetetrahydrofolate reductase [NAD(P)H] [Spongisporangium articulatum]|uniref:Methylenetetrahydrofolate reductase n=1 Tax=Spongisporangium articulatum TaxID=3362603 RepID=A0ABW8AST2_9ACTN
MPAPTGDPTGSAPGSLPAALAELRATGRPSISFEFGPPRDDAAEAVFWQTIRVLEPLAPTFVSVTYGAGGSTRDRTVRITQQLAQTTTLTPVGHLTCVGASRSELRRVIGEYADAGVRNIMALRGDPKEGPRAPWTPHPDGLNYAVELVRLARELGSFGVGVAAFPDVHPASTDLDADARVLALKAEAGAQFAVTQFFFTPDDYFRLVDRVAALGCDIPILPGIMPVTSVKSIQRMAELSGADMPAQLIERLHAVADDPAAVRAVGVDVATELGSALLEGGAPGLHFYTMNRSTATLEVYERLGLAARV